MPLAVLPLFVSGLFSLALLLGGGYILYAWWQHAITSSLMLGIGIGMLVLTFSGRLLILALHRKGRDDPSWSHDTEITRVTRPDGTTLHVECSGPDDGLPIVLIHGWGVDNRALYYTKRWFSREHRVIAWDLRGLGRSSHAGNNDYSLDAMADDLAAIVGLASTGAVIIGHSIGGMIALTFARRHAERLGSDVIALAIVGSTDTDPTHTMLAATTMRALERPLLRPLAYVSIGLFPLIWAMNWLSYLNGSQFIGTALSGFSGHESRAQLDFATRFLVKAHPAVVARGMLAMFDFDERSSIGNISIPVLVVSGDRDPVVLPKTSRHIAAVIPGATFHVVPGTKHMSIIERHENFNTRVMAFVEEHAAAHVRTHGSTRKQTEM